MTNVGRSRLVLYLAAVLSYVAALIHFFVIPQHFEEWWGYGTFFLGVGAFQGLYALVLLQWPGSSLFFSGIAANLAIVALWLVTRTVGIPFFGPHAGEVEAIGAADLAATTVELALSVALVALWRSARQPAALLPGGAADASENRPDLSVWRGAWRGERVLMLVGVAAVATLGTALVMTLLTRPPGDGSPEAGFARDISVHHAQAVEMAEIVRDRTESEEVRTLATDIALTQQAQIGQMQGWLAVWGLPVTSTEPAMAWMGHPMDGPMPGMATPEEVNRLGTLPPDKADALFLKLMIPHHKAALGMTEAVLQETDRPEVEELAGAISTSQRAEIAVMEEMLRERGEEAPAGNEAPGSMDSMPGMEHGGQEGDHK